MRSKTIELSSPNASSKKKLHGCTTCWSAESSNTSAVVELFSLILVDPFQSLFTSRRWQCPKMRQGVKCCEVAWHFGRTLLRRLLWSVVATWSGSCKSQLRMDVATSLIRVLRARTGQLRSDRRPSTGGARVKAGRATDKTPPSTSCQEPRSDRISKKEWRMKVWRYTTQDWPGPQMCRWHVVLILPHFLESRKH